MKGLKPRLVALSKVREKLLTFREKNAAVLDQLHKLQEAEANEVAAIKAIVRVEGDKLSAGNHKVAEGHGVVVEIMRKRKVDGEALIALNPKVLKLARRVSVTIPREELDRLVAAGVITEENVEECTTLESAVVVKSGGEVE